MNATANIWVFGYGSLIWRPGFVFEQKQIVSVEGFSRRFCQASHDHRGTPEHSGRVVTLVTDCESVCEGVAFEVSGSTADEVLRLLDVREQDGYQRQILSLVFPDGSIKKGVTWIAQEGNPSWRGGESVSEVADIIAARSGPSGSNSAYLYELQNALNTLGIVDLYVKELVELVRRQA